MDENAAIRHELHSLITDHFSYEELQILSIDLSIDYDHLAGGTKSIKIISLLLYALRHGRIPALTDQLRKYRPAVPWPDLSSAELEFDFVGKDNRRKYPLSTLIDVYFDKGDIKILCYKLGVDYDNLAGDTKQARIPSLLAALENKGRILDFMELIQGERPHVHWPPFTVQELNATFPPKIIPRQQTNFVGREEDLQWLLESLQLGRVVTLWGAGGMGKTALAIEALHRLTPEDYLLASFKDGILFYSFSGHGEVNRAYNHIIRSFAPLISREGDETIVSQVLSDKEALLVFDSTEEADNLSALLACCGSCGVLLTTQKRTDAPKTEWRREVEPLQQSEASTLFLNAVQGEDIPQSTADQICQQLGWMPLAVYLAGRYIDGSGFTATEYLEWLKTTPIEAVSQGNKKEDSIRILLDKTMQRLSQQTQLVLGVAGRLAQSPFVLGPVISALDMGVVTVRIAMGELVNFGLATRKDDYYTLTHPLLHAYARQHSIDTAVFVRLITYYTLLAQSQGQPEAAEYLRLDDEYAHFVEILKGAEKQNDKVDLIQLTLALRYFWEVRGYWRDGKQWLEKALVASESAYAGRDRQQVQGQIQLVLGGFLYRLGDFVQADMLLRESRENARQVGDSLTQARACRNLGLVQRYGLGEPNTALLFFLESRDLSLALDGSAQPHEKTREILISEIEVSGCYLDKCIIDPQEKDFEVDRQKAQNMLQACLGHYQSAGIQDKQLEAHIYHSLGIALQLYGTSGFVGAKNYYKRALHLSQQTGERGQMAELEVCLGEVCFGLDQIEVALEHFDKSKTIAEEIWDHQMLEYLQDTVTDFQSQLASNGQEDMHRQYTLWLKALILNTGNRPDE